MHKFLKKIFLMPIEQVIFIEEQGLRDGLQTLSLPIAIDTKLKWIDTLVNSGIKRMQIGSFVHPKLVPMMADSDKLFLELNNRLYNGVVFSALVLNIKGVQRAIECGVKHLSISLSASNTHSLKNAGKNLLDSKTQLAEMIKLAQSHGIKIRSGIQCAFGCRFEGQIDKNIVLELVDFILDFDVDEISLADSTGMGNPIKVENMVAAVKEKSKSKLLGLHLHNTENKGYANIYAGLKAGANIIDTAFGGLGGCPFIKGATGNVATEDTVHMMEQMGIQTGVDLSKVASVSRDIENLLGTPLPGLLYKLP